MGLTLDRKRSIISSLIIISYLISFFGVKIYFGNNVSVFLNNHNVYIRVALLIGLPLTLSTLYVLYSLRERLVYKILLIINTIQFLIICVGTLTGYFDSNMIYLSVFIPISNIKNVIYVALLIIAFIQKEKALTFVYLSLSLILGVLFSSNTIINGVASVINDIDKILMIFKVLNISQIVLSAITVVVLVIVYYKSDELSNKNQIQKENELYIENY